MLSGILARVRLAQAMTEADRLLQGLPEQDASRAAASEVASDTSAGTSGRGGTTSARCSSSGGSDACVEEIAEVVMFVWQAVLFSQLRFPPAHTHALTHVRALTRTAEGRET